MPGAGDYAYINNGGTAWISGITAAADLLYLGYNTGETGYVNQTTGSLTVGTEYVGYYGWAGHTHSGGTNSVTTLWLGYRDGTGNVGTYNLSGTGVLSAGTEYVGSSTKGEFFQNGGTNTAGSLNLGNKSTGRGFYDLNSGQLTVTGIEYIGKAGSGTFSQTGGTHTIGSDLYISYPGANKGIYNMDGGTLEIGGSLIVGSNFGEFNFISDVSISIGGDLIFKDGAKLTAVAGSVIHLTGSNFYNESTSASNMAGLGNTEFIFEGGVGVLDTYEVAGLVDGGFVGNFAQGALTLGGADEGHLQLVDAYDNGNRGTEDEECLFVSDFTISADSSLDVNGFLLYESGDHADEWNTWIADGWLFDGTNGSLNAFYDSDNDWTTFGGGVIPEPSTIILIGCSLVGLAGILRRRLR